MQLPKFGKRLRLIVDTASPITFINAKTWIDIGKPKLSSTSRILGAFEGQKIIPIGYFETSVCRDENPSIIKVMQF